MDVAIALYLLVLIALSKLVLDVVSEIRRGPVPAKGVRDAPRSSNVLGAVHVTMDKWSTPCAVYAERGIAEQHLERDGALYVESFPVQSNPPPTTASPVSPDQGADP